MCHNRGTQALSRQLLYLRLMRLLNHCNRGTRLLIPKSTSFVFYGIFRYRPRQSDCSSRFLLNPLLDGVNRAPQVMGLRNTIAGAPLRLS